MLLQKMLNTREHLQYSLLFRLLSPAALLPFFWASTPILLSAVHCMLCVSCLAVNTAFLQATEAVTIMHCRHDTALQMSCSQSALLQTANNA